MTITQAMSGIPQNLVIDMRTFILQANLFYSIEASIQLIFAQYNMTKASMACQNKDQVPLQFRKLYKYKAYKKGTCAEKTS